MQMRLIKSVIFICPSYHNSISLGEEGAVLTEAAA